MPDKPPAVERVRAKAFTVPTDAPEADGTLTWDGTTIVGRPRTGLQVQSRPAGPGLRRQSD